MVLLWCLIVKEVSIQFNNSQTFGVHMDQVLGKQSVSIYGT